MAMSVGQDSGEEATAIADINTTPLVDIMLVLLIIFLITVPVLKKSYVTIPKAVNIPTQTKPENITLQVDREGTIYWNGGVLNDKQVFFQRIVAEARKVPQPEFHLRGDKEARWEYIGRVIYSLQRGGIVKVGFITEPDPKSIHVTR
ncbi:MAG TPA: biopolymer transporter ExbD [Steroidobacteraceae bacterium]|jgi:biopolymer transport protein ExbD|nr:biopolymer transporter ExbD [Steroidobacteraceae bacterium]